VAKNRTAPGTVSGQEIFILRVAELIFSVICEETGDMSPNPMISILRWCLLAALWLASVSQAETVRNLYQAESPVMGQSGEVRAAGIQNAFAQVLVKVSGDRGLLSNPEIGQLLKRASSYVQQYRYRMLETQVSDKADRLLWVSFDERGVNRLLRQSGIPVWGVTRPTVLIWLGEERGASRSLVSFERQGGLKSVVKRAAGDRGLPLVLPLMDVQDRNALPVSDLWGGFESDIRRASGRYLPDVILVGRLSDQGGEWRGEWSLYLPDKVNRWQTRAASKQALAREGLQQTADVLALRFAPQQVSENSAGMRIRVHGLTKLADYALVRNYLQSLAMIEQLDLLSAEAESVSFLVRVQGGRQVLERGIQLGAVLEPVMSPEPQAVEGDSPQLELEGESLDYRLR
jgi:hypothetical protein